MIQPCPIQRRLQAFLDGQLTPADEALIEQHVDGCPECRRFLDEVTEESSHAPLLAATTDSMVEEPLTPRLRRNVAAAFAAEVGTFYSTGSDDPTKPEQHSSREDWPSVPGYEVTGMLGRGGIGIVYRASDQRLKRPVALKIIRHQATPDERERLQREAEALATLRHPGVVQIYEIGEHQGRPFLALEYVAGGSLSRHLSGKAQLPRAAARLVATLAETMDLAHQRGLVHRDLKPANVLLHWENESRLHDDLNYCRPKVTDFGLVKNMSVESGLTHSRDLLGTPSYMAPEQAGGDPETVGPACDIWALGAILYELMTGRPPFHGANAVDTLMQVRQAEPVPPSRLQAKLPRDLETICLKCLEKAPNQRYATARELAEDLHRFRDGQTIQARPVSSAGRMWRWCRRNPAVSLLSGLAVLLLLALAVGGPVAAYREAGLRREAFERAVQAENERERAGKNLDLATLALDDTLKNVYRQLGVRPETMREFDQHAWAATIPYLEQLVSQPANSPESRLRKARAMRQLARSLSDRGEKDRSTEMFDHVIHEVNEMADASSNRADIQRELGMCHLELGKNLAPERKQTPKSEEQYRKAIAILEPIVAAHPEVDGYREDLANAKGQLGEGMLFDPARFKEAAGLLAQAAALRRELVDRHPNNWAYQSSEAYGLFSLGLALSETGKVAEAEAAFCRAIELATRQFAKRSSDGQLLGLIAVAEEGLAANCIKTNRLDQAQAYATRSTEKMDRLVNAFPAAAHYVDGAIRSHDLLRRVHVLRQDWDGAAQQIKANLAINRKFREAHPEDRKAKIEEALQNKGLGDIYRRMGRKADAIEQYQKAITQGEALAGGATISDEFLVRIISLAHIEYAELLLAGGDIAGAITQNDAAIAVLSPDEIVPTNRENRLHLKRALLQQAKCLRILGREGDAAILQDRANAIEPSK